MTDKRFIEFCNERAKVLSEYRDVCYYINVLTDVNKQRVTWLEFVGLIETAHLIWYHEYTNNLD
ncbi:hypothetical protein LCGC14_1062180, partial [marine sediment metagenome]